MFPRNDNTVGERFTSPGNEANLRQVVGSGEPLPYEKISRISYLVSIDGFTDTRGRVFLRCNDSIVGEGFILPGKAVISTERSEWRDLFCSIGNRSLDFARDDKESEDRFLGAGNRSPAKVNGRFRSLIFTVYKFFYSFLEFYAIIPIIGKVSLEGELTWD